MPPDEIFSAAKCPNTKYEEEKNMMEMTLSNVISNASVSPTKFTMPQTYEMDTDNKPMHESVLNLSLKDMQHSMPNLPEMQEETFRDNSIP